MTSSMDSSSPEGRGGVGTGGPKSLFGLTPVQEALALWGTSFLAIVIAFLVAPSQSSLVATVSFLYLPYIFMSKRNEDYRDYGVSLAAWRQDLLNAGVLALLVTPLFIAGFWLFMRWLAWAPPIVAHWITPLTSHLEFRPRLPPHLLKQVVGQVLVVALPEEFFYRGYLLARLKEAWPPTRRMLGIPVGRAFFATALLFALGHLAIFQAWRLWVFFPALLFGWLKERTGTIFGSTLFHAFCNLLEAWLEVSF